MTNFCNLLTREALTSSAEGVTDPRAKRMVFDLVHLDEGEIHRKYENQAQNTPLPPIVAQILKINSQFTCGFISIILPLHLRVECYSY